MRAADASKYLNHNNNFAIEEQPFGEKSNSMLRSTVVQHLEFVSQQDYKRFFCHALYRYSPLFAIQTCQYYTFGNPQ